MKSVHFHFHAVTRCVAITLLLMALAPMQATADDSPAPTAEMTARSDATENEPAQGGGRDGARSSERSQDIASTMTLDEITIEGEIDVPQVLFITSRDHLRRSDLLHHLYQSDAAAVAAAAPTVRALDTWALRPVLGATASSVLFLLPIAATDSLSVPDPEVTNQESK